MSATPKFTSGPWWPKLSAGVIYADHEDQIEANANLIAAAPDLLAVAEMVLDTATIETPGELLAAAKAAIAKAEGRR